MTSEQETKLREFWSRFFQLVDEAPVEGSDNPKSGGGGSGDNDAKNAGKDIPKDDAAKEKQRAEQEMKDANARSASRQG